MQRNSLLPLQSKYSNLALRSSWYSDKIVAVSQNVFAVSKVKSYKNPARKYTYTRDGQTFSTEGYMEKLYCCRGPHILYLFTSVAISKYKSMII